MPVARDQHLSADLVRSLLRYEPETGNLFWKVDRGAVKAGALAGHRNSEGYIVVKIRGRGYQGHRLAWVIMTGTLPDDEVDHRDLDRLNNRWDNLRAASHGQNQSNCSVYRRTATRLKGAYPHPNNPFKFVSAIRKDGKRIHLGVFDTAEDAHRAYAKAAQELHGEFGRAA